MQVRRSRVCGRAGGRGGAGGAGRAARGGAGRAGGVPMLETRPDNRKPVMRMLISLPPTAARPDQWRQVHRNPVEGLDGRG